VDELRGVRTDLATWLAPEPELGFIVTERPSPAIASPATVLQPPQWAFAHVPAWARAAAAVLVIGAGLGLANVRVSYGAGGLDISTGWMTPASVALASTGVTPDGATSASARTASVTGAGAAKAASNTEWRPELAALEADLRKEMQSLRSSNSAAVPAVARTGGGDEQAILRRVQSLIQESERRQQQDFALRLRQFGSDVEMQRRADLVRLEQGFDRFQGRNGAAIAQQQRVLDLLVRASTKVP
jgi:hypothetical protein